MNSLPSINLFGVKVTVAPEEEILEYIIAGLKTPREKLFITTPNPEIIMYARSHPEFRKMINEASIALPDGIGVTLGAYLTGKGYRARVTGVDLVEKLCSNLAKSPYSVGFFGGVANVAEYTSECLQKKYSGLTVSYASDVWDTHKMSGKHIDVLFVAMGFPKQEKWIFENLDSIPVTAAIGVGGAFDFISGKVKRAPYIFQLFGFEWLYRLITQPWRWKRQLALISFSLLVFQEMVRMRIRSGKRVGK